MSSEPAVKKVKIVEELFKTDDMYDCEFEFPNKEKIRSHRSILGAASPVFKAMLFGELRNKEGTEKIGQTEPDIFKKMLQFIYTNSTELESVETACKLYTVGDEYMIPDLKNYCENYIIKNINVTTFIYLVNFFKLYDNKNIYDKCINFITSDIATILKSENFLKFDVNILILISEQSARNISEVEFFTAIEKWAEHQAAEQGLSLRRFIPFISVVKRNIHFLLMKGDEFAKGPGISEFLTSDEQRAIALNIHCPGVCPIPKGLSLFRRPQIKYQYRFDGISNKLMYSYRNPYSKSMVSDRFKVKTATWELKLVAEVFDKNINGYSHIALYIGFLGIDDCQTATCDAIVELKFLRKIAGCQPYQTCFQKEFSNLDSNTSRSHPHSMEWNTFFNEKNEFYVDGGCTVEATVELTESHWCEQMN